MAIIISQEPTAFYPSYNDSFIKFTTDYVNDDKAVIKLDGTYQFTIFPDNGGNYLFNMREIAKALINSNQFKDNVGDSVAGWGVSDTSLFKEIYVEIIAYGDDLSENTNRTYSFTKAVKQFGDRQFNNPYQLMLPSKDGVKYSLTYWEGYPIDITLRYLKNTDALTIKNLRTEQVTDAFIPEVNAPYRLVIDKSTSNWHTAGVMDLPDMVNNLNLIVNDVMQTSIELTKKADECGKYLKWFNADGSYSYWLFHQWYKQDHAGKEIDRVSTNNYSNIYGNNEGLTKLSGKSGASGIKLKTIVTEEEKNHLISLVTAPVVWLWSEEDPYQDGEWISVKVTSNGFSYSNKRTRNQIEVEIELPEVNTQIL